jgi:polyhydroxyalkanoate synthesis regulator phasin
MHQAEITRVGNLVAINGVCPLAANAARNLRVTPQELIEELVNNRGMDDVSASRIVDDLYKQTTDIQKRH